MMTVLNDQLTYDDYWGHQNSGLSSVNESQTRTTVCVQGSGFPYTKESHIVDIVGDQGSGFPWTRKSHMMANGGS